MTVVQSWNPQRPKLDSSNRPQVAQCLPPRESSRLRTSGFAWRDRFLTYWTLKEAYLKARGLGISVPLREISFVLQPDGAQITFLGSLAGTPTDWTFQLERPTGRHLVAIAVASAAGVSPSIAIEPYRF